MLGEIQEITDNSVCEMSTMNVRLLRTAKFKIKKQKKQDLLAMTSEL